MGNANAMVRLRDIVLRNKDILILEYILILCSCLMSVFLKHSYSSNIYLAWEGAYRLYLGQVPFKDFGIPLGFGMWLIPALFFKLFGPYLITLIKAQAFINILSAFAFLSILKQLKVKPEIRFLSVLLFTISFSLFHLWPWYNHSDIVFEFIGLAFLLKYIFSDGTKYRLIKLFIGSFFLFLSFFTKQDGGGLGLLIAFVLIICHALYERKPQSVFWFLGSYLFFGLCFFLPFVPYHIGYWFNYGQPPYSARLSVYDILNVFFGQSEWIKFYLLIIFLILLFRFKHPKDAIRDKYLIIFSLLVIGILFEASIIQVTSFTDPLNNLFFHSFVLAYIFSASRLSDWVNFKRPLPFLLTSFFILIWWSVIPWGPVEGFIGNHFPDFMAVDSDQVSIRSFQRVDPHFTWKTSQTPDASRWGYSPWKVFKEVSMPHATISGIQRILDNPIVKAKGKSLRVLNMTELTPLAELIGYTPETGANIPLWNHKNVGTFERQIKDYDKRIDKNYYDIALFEYIPILNNFFPFEVRDTLRARYTLIDSFPAPRDLFYRIIEVYTPKSEAKPSIPR